MDALAVDVDLARALLDNDRRRAGTLLVTHYASDVFALCRAIVRDRDVAEDLAQDAFQKALVALPSFRGESSARTWLLSIARNRCLDHLRSAKSSPFERDDDGDSDAHASTEAPVLELLVRREDVERALGPLDETERAIVVLFHGHGVGYAELATAFGLREGAVRMRMSRAIGKMRDVLASDGAPRTGRELLAEEEAALGASPRQVRRRTTGVPRAEAFDAARDEGGPGSQSGPPRGGPPASRAGVGGPPVPAAAPRRPAPLVPAQAAPGVAPPPPPARAAPVPMAPAGAAPPPPPPPAMAAPAPMAPRALATPDASSAADAVGKKGAGLLERVKSMVLGARAAAAPAPVRVPSASPLHEDAPPSLVERLLALAASQ